MTPTLGDAITLGAVGALILIGCLLCLAVLRSLNTVDRQARDLRAARALSSTLERRANALQGRLARMEAEHVFSRRRTSPDAYLGSEDLTHIYPGAAAPGSPTRASDTDIVQLGPDTWPVQTTEYGARRYSTTDGT